MESRWEFTAPQFVDFAAIDLDDLEEDKFFDVNNETREEEEEERVRGKLAFPTPGFQSCYNSDEEEDGNVVKEPKNGESSRKSRSAGRSRRAPLTAPGGQLSARKVGGRSMAERNLFKASASRSRASYGSSRGPVAVLNAQKKNKKMEAVFLSRAEQVARFQKTTPLRFRSRPLGGINTDAAGQETRNKPKSLRNREHGGRLPARQLLPSTEPTPFQLEGSKRLEERAAVWQAEVLRMQELEREGHKFKAREAAVLRTMPFVPQPVRREAVANIHGPDLCTDRRAVEREKFEARRREKELEAEATKVKKQEEKYREELEEVAEQRKQTVHKARPMPKYTRLEVVASQKKVTTATSPFLLTKRNARGSK